MRRSRRRAPHALVLVGPLIAASFVANQPGPAPQPAAPPPFDPHAMMCFENVETQAPCDGDPAPAATSDLRTTFCTGWSPDCSQAVQPGAGASADEVVFFLPPSFEPVRAPVGSIAGRVEADLLFGLLNLPCRNGISAGFTLVNASVDVNDAIRPKAVGRADVMAPLARDADGNALADGVDRYPEFLRNAFDVDWDAGLDGVPYTPDDVAGPQPPPQPIVRLSGLARIDRNWISLQFVSFAPGTTLRRPDGSIVTYGADLGYPTFLVVQDPTTPGSPNWISELCPPQRLDIVIFGRTLDNPCSGGLPVATVKTGCPLDLDMVYENAGVPLLPCDTGNAVDEDLDGAVNDGCPQVNAIPETGAECANNVSDDSEDGIVNDGCVAVGAQEGTRTGGQPGSACSGVDEGGCLTRRNPATAGVQAFTLAARSGRDADGDGLDNVLDTCALKANPRWNAYGADPVNDADSDGLPYECDPHPQQASAASPPLACQDAGIVGADEDGDCYSNRQDNCPLHANVTQSDADRDALGDVCDEIDCLPDDNVCALFGMSAGGPEIPDGERADVCLTFALEVETGASTTPVVGKASGGAECAIAGPAPTVGPTASADGSAAPSPDSVAPARLPATGGHEGSGALGSTAAVVAVAGIAIGAIAMVRRGSR